MSLHTNAKPKLLSHKIRLLKQNVKEKEENKDVDQKLLLKSFMKIWMLSEADAINLISIVDFGQDFNILLKKWYRSIKITMVLLPIYFTTKNNVTFMMFVVSFLKNFYRNWKNCETLLPFCNSLAIIRYRWIHPEQNNGVIWL